MYAHRFEGTWIDGQVPDNRRVCGAIPDSKDVPCSCIAPLTSRSTSSLTSSFRASSFRCESSASDTSLSTFSENFSIVTWVSCNRTRTEVPVLSAGAEFVSPTGVKPALKPDPDPEAPASLFSK